MTEQQIEDLAESIFPFKQYTNGDCNYRIIISKMMEMYKAALQTHYHIADNSDGFRNWLEKKGIFYLRNGHFTSIELEGNDIFQLGVEFGLYRQQLKASLSGTERVECYLPVKFAEAEVVIRDERGLAVYVKKTVLTVLKESDLLVGVRQDSIVPCEAPVDSSNTDGQ